MNICLISSNTENLGRRLKDIDERVVEQEIVRNMRDFILQFGKDFIFLWETSIVCCTSKLQQETVERKYWRNVWGPYISTGIRPYCKKATRKSFYWYCVMQRNEQGFC